MKDATSTISGIEEQDMRLLSILENVTIRRLAGEELPDDEVIELHPDLMPELGEKLIALRLAERARQTALDSGVLTLDDGSSGSTVSGPNHEFLPIDAFHGYRIESEIGQGAMGVVYRALQKTTRRQVAIKVMVEGPFAGTNDRVRFQQEAQILGQLKHPHIVTIHESGVAAGRFFMVMDYVDGPPLDHYLVERRFSLEEKIELFAKVCEAVNAAHLRGVIHRDLKPSNIRVDASGEPQVLDFGLAKLADNAGTTNLLERSMTLTGQFVGSLPWASPEQAEGTPDQIDLRTDVYALGVILYQILTQRFPYPVIGHLRTVIDHILNTEPQRPSRSVSSIDDDLDTIVLKCLAKDPARRYQSAADLSRDLRHYLANEPIDAKRDSSWYILRKSIRRHRLSFGVAAGLLILIAGFGVTMALMYRHAESQADKATRTLAFLQDTLFDASSRKLGPDATLAQVLEEASERADEKFRSEPALAAAIQFTVGDAYESVWRRNDAAEHLGKALQLYESAHGPKHPDTLKTKVLLGMVLAELRDPNSVAMEKEALKARLETLGPDDVLIADSKSNLAFTYWSAAVPRQWEKAEKLYQEALAIYRGHLGPEHYDIEQCLFAYGAMHHALRNLDRARELYGEAMEMSRKLFGDDHQSTIESSLQYAVVLQQQERYDEAESMLTELMDRVPKRFGENRRPGMMRAMADLEMSRGNLQAAQRWEHDALALSLQQLVADHPQDAGEINELVNQLRGTSDDVEAIPPYREAIATYERLSQQPGTAASMLIDLSSLLSQQGRDARAEPLLRDAVQYAKSLKLKNSIFTEYAVNTLGACLLKLRRYGEAEPLLVESHDSLSSELTYVHPLARTALARMIELYERWGKPQKAAEFKSLQQRVNAEG